MSGLDHSIEAWYSEDPSRSARLDQILRGDVGFSLREIDHFVTNMTVRRPVIFVNANTGKIVDVNSDYRNFLRCYHKAGFDSFNRKGGLDIKQKNFFRWALENGVVDYVAAHVREIERDMAETRRQAPAPKKQKTSRANFAIIQQVKEVQIPTFTNIVW
jgi:hypothetical protein